MNAAGRLAPTVAPEYEIVDSAWASFEGVVIVSTALLDYAESPVLAYDLGHSGEPR